MPVSQLSEFRLGATLARYQRDDSTGRVGLLLLPAGRRDAEVPRREFLGGVEVDAYAAANQTRLPAWGLDSLVQVQTTADDLSPAFATGRTLRNGGTVDRLAFAGQSVTRAGGRTVIRTTMRHPDGWLAHHDLAWQRGAPWLESVTTVENASAAPVTLILLSSFSLDGVTPFAADDAPGRLWLHRFRSVWSIEGRLDSRSFEDLQLERSWSGWGVRVERFGVVGSMPVNGWFPRALIEDRGAGVVWGAQLAHNASWQLEVYRRGDTVAFSGGLADRDLGHWQKTLAPGESLVSPTAQLACVAGTLDDACDALNAAQEPPLARQPRVEQSLPVIVNEWATSWGTPSHDNIVRMAENLRSTGVRYLVMDAGWYAPPTGAWGSAHGDWEPSPALYPQGLRATADAIRAAGLIPGLWFEMETCGKDSALFRRTDLLLHRDGRPLTTGVRRHLDLRRPEAHAYLAERVIGLLRAGGFGYLKVDYNETVGAGPDGDESCGEGLRRHAAGSHAFFRRIREELPDLVIENCSSGGHRLEPSMFALTAMSSFSDAHECPEIPIVAAHLHRLMLPRQSQIWATLRQGEGDHRTVYSIAAGFLGRLCFSGDLVALDEKQRLRLRESVALYRRCAPTIRRGRSRLHGPPVAAWRHAEGWQAVVRERADGREMLVVAHTFARPGTRRVEAPLPAGRWRIADVFASGRRAPEITAGALRWPVEGEWRGLVARLVRA